MISFAGEQASFRVAGVELEIVAGIFANVPAQDQKNVLVFPNKLLPHAVAVIIVRKVLFYATIAIAQPGVIVVHISVRHDDDAMVGMLFDDGRSPVESDVAGSEFNVQNEEFQPAGSVEILVAVVVAVFETSTPPAFLFEFGWRKELIDAADIANHLSAIPVDPRPVEVVIADVETIGKVAIQFLVTDDGTFPFENVVVLNNIAFMTDERNPILFGVFLQPTSLACVDVRMPV